MTYMLPVSVKGIVFENGKVWLRKNERNEWELPGGKLDEHEQLEMAVRREMSEELGYKVEVHELISADLYHIPSQNSDEEKGVLVITYLCEVLEKTGVMELIGEAGKAEFQQFSPEELHELHIENFYVKAIYNAYKKGNSITF